LERWGFALAQALPNPIPASRSRGRPIKAKEAENREQRERRHRSATIATTEMLAAARWLYGSDQKPSRPISVLVSAIAEEKFPQSSVLNLRKTRFP
jgi:hypothetical protein